MTSRRPSRRIAPLALERLEARDTPSRNVIVFVADGLRNGSVNPTDAPTLTALRGQGVDFANSHSLFPTFTTPNASAIATGHLLGDTGDFSNSIYTGYPVFGGTNTPFIESNPVLGDIDAHFPGNNFLGEESLLAFARQNGYSTAAVGKQGPVLIQDVTQGNPAGGTVPPPQTVVIDDSTGRAGGVPLAADVAAALTGAGLPTQTPARTSANTPNTTQQQFFVDALTKAILPRFQQKGQPFALVYWARDPDGTQHGQTDSLDQLTPGINGPNSRAAVRNTDANLKQLLDYVSATPGLAGNTDVFVTADHGFGTISRHLADAQGGVVTDFAATQTYASVNPGYLPPGFVAIDLAHALALPLFDPDGTQAGGAYPAVDPTQGQRPRNGNGLVGGTGKVGAEDAKVVVAANGGSDLIYVPSKDPAVVRQVVATLSAQGYTSGLFVDDAFGPVPGTLPLSAIGLKGSTALPTPAVVINFRTFSADPADPLQSGVEIADTGLQQGQGMHGSFGRQDTFNNMIAFGPDFKAGFRDPAPISNADVVPTLASILGFSIPSNGDLKGRVVREALAGGPDAPAATTGTLRSATADDGTQTVLNYQVVNGVRYYDAAGYANRAVGLKAAPTLYAVGAANGGGPEVKVYNGDGTVRFDFFAYEGTFRGGVVVTTGDVTGDGVPDVITGAGVGGGPVIKLFDGVTGQLVKSFFAYEDTFRGGVNVAVGDVNGDGRPDIVAGTGVGGAPRVVEFDGVTGQTLGSFFAFDPAFRGGVNVAAGDLDGTGKARVVAGAGTGGGPQVRVFDLAGVALSSFFAFDPAFRGGVNVAAGDVTGTGKAAIIAGAGTGGGPQVRLFDAAGKSQADAFVFDATSRGGVRVGAQDVNGDGRADVLAGGGSGGTPRVKVLSGKDLSVLSDALAFDSQFTGGVFVG